MNKNIFSNDEIDCSIYARFSSNLQKEKSIEDQIRNCRQYAALRGWRILEDHIFFDKAIPGSSMEPRDGINSLMEIAKSKDPPFRYILVDDTSRVARNTIDALKVFAELSFNDIYAYYVSQGIDTAQENAEELITLHGLMDARYLKELSKRTHRGIVGQILKGFSGGSKRYGYKSKPVYGNKIDIYGNPLPEGYKLEIYWPEAQVITRIYKMYGEERLSVRQIISILNKELKETGAPKPPRGDYWSVRTILGSRTKHAGILNNELYIGKYVWNKTTSKKNLSQNKKRIVHRLEGEWITTSRDELRIVSNELWGKVKGRQKEVARATKGLYNKSRHLYSMNLLTGLIKCNECGGNIVIVSGNKGKYQKYGCRTNRNKGFDACPNGLRISKDVLEGKIIDAIADILTEEKCTEYVTKNVSEKIRDFYKNKQSHSRKNDLREELKKVEKELDNVATAIGRGLFSDTIKNIFEQKEHRKKCLLKELEELTINKNDNKKVAVHPVMIEKYLSGILDTLNIQPILGREALFALLGTIKFIRAEDSWELEINKKVQIKIAG